jgi:hypothetical protein
MVKLETDTLPTVPDAPPEAGPDRALDPPPDAGPLATALPDTSCPFVADGEGGLAEDEVARPTETPITRTRKGNDGDPSALSAGEQSPCP